MNNKRLNYAIPLYFDESLSYAEMVANLQCQMKNLDEQTAKLLEAIVYDQEKNQTEIKGDLSVSGTIYGNIDLQGGTIEANLNGIATQAESLTTNAGNSSIPVYFENGKPVAVQTIAVDSTANAATATKLVQSRKIQLINDVVGEAYFDGSGNIQIATQIKGTTPEAITTIPNDLTIVGDLTVHDVICETGYEFIGDLQGNAATSTQLTTNAGNSSIPVYFENGKPVAVQSLSLDTTGNAATATNAINAINATSATTATSAEHADSADNATNSDVANKLSTSAGSASLPVYFNEGVPVAVDQTTTSGIHSIFNGTTEPSNEIGNNGDIYILYE